MASSARSAPLVASASAVLEHAALFNKELGTLGLRDRKITFHSAAGDERLTIDVGSLTGHKISGPKTPVYMLQVISSNGTFVFQFTSSNAVLDRESWNKTLNVFEEENSANMRPSVLRAVHGSLAGPSPVTSSSEPSADRSIAKPTALASKSAATTAPKAADAELRLRAQLLATNSSLRDVHTELVRVKAIVTEEEFWDQRRVREKLMFMREHAKRPDLMSRLVAVQALIAAEAIANQRTGRSAAMRAPAVGSGCNTYTVQLTQDDIDAIFLQSPDVMKAYHENVPDKVSEVEFWNRYFRNQQMNQLGVYGSATQASEDPLFSKSGTDSSGIRDPSADGDRYKLAVSQDVDPTVDLTSSDDPLGEVTSSDAFHPAAELALQQQKETRQRQDVIRKYNRHASLVLQADSRRRQSQQSMAGASPSSAPLDSDTSVTEATQIRRSQLAESLALEDLSADTSADFVELKIQDSSVYVSGSGVTAVEELVTSSDADFSKYFKHIGVWAASTLTSLADDGPQHQLRACGLPVMERLTREANASYRANDASSHDTGNHKVYSTDNQPDVVISEAFKSEMRRMFVVLSELLRHFWACFSDLVKFRDKLHRLHKSLEMFGKELQEIRTRMNHNHQSRFVPLLRPLEVMLQRAFDRHDAFVIASTRTPTQQAKRKEAVDLTVDAVQKRNKQ